MGPQRGDSVRGSYLFVTEMRGGIGREAEKKNAAADRRRKRETRRAKTGELEASNDGPSSGTSVT